MSEIIERVARAMHEELAGGDPDELIHHPAQNSWEPPTRKRWEQWEDAARAAIEAMRPATAAMLEAGMHEPFPGESPRLGVWECAETWVAMIETALSEGKP